MVNLGVYLAALLMIAGGLAWKDPAWAAVVVGSVVLCTVVVSRLGGRKG
jgi:hypothetical protein